MKGAIRYSMKRGWQWRQLLTLAVIAAVALTVLSLAPAAQADTIAGAGEISFGVRSDGILVIWGNNRNADYSSWGRIVAVSARGNNCMALKADGTVEAWGYNGICVCDVPFPLLEDFRVVAVAAGGEHRVALSDWGEVVAWGNNQLGQCNLPGGLYNAVAVAAGNEHSLALKADGTVVAWGSNGNGQRDIPSGLNGVVAVAAGDDHNLALKADGTVVAWGDNRYGQCNVPAGLSGVVAVSAGGLHNLALKADGTVVAWGYTQFWTEEFWKVPAGLSGVVAVSAGHLQSLALKADGTVVAWGNNGFGQCNVPATTFAIPPVANAGSNNTVHTGEPVQLSGSGADLDNNLPLRYAWACASGGAYDFFSPNPNVFNPTFVPLSSGDYRLFLIVTDSMGIRSQPSWVTISSTNAPPNSNAGPPQSVRHGVLVTLDGSGSNDPNGDNLTYAWTWVSRPSGSNAALSDAASCKPTFTVDAVGDYTLQLIVTDRWGACSQPAYVTISTTNSRPVANAGSATTAHVGAPVTLDGAGSSDPDGDAITFAWKINSAPAGSTATLVSDTTTSPSFTPDKTGDYLVQLVVTDCWGAASPPAFVAISTTNSPPVANAGINQTVHEGATVTLDGSKSSDPDGDSFTFAWSLTSRPEGSTAQLSGQTAVSPTLTTDAAGDYVAQLIVTDCWGAASPAARVTISTTNSPPVADAGPAKAVTVIGSTVQLDGTQSYDLDGDAITYQWSLLKCPAGSRAQLSDPAAHKPTFVPDFYGEYLVQLVVTDSWQSKSAPTTVTVSFNNVKPVANAGNSLSVTLGDAVYLNGAGSTDANGDPLSYRWSFAISPAGSSWNQTVFTSAAPSFIPDLGGTYVMQLVVNDGFVDSNPNNITIQVAVTATAVIKVIQNTVQPKISGLDPMVFVNVNLQNSIQNQLNAVIAKIDAGNYAAALGQLQHDILPKVDGVATTGKPDKNDWIKDPSAQTEVYNYLTQVIAVLEALR